MRTWWRVLAVLAVLAGAVLVGAPAQAAPAGVDVPFIDADCKTAPIPASPSGNPLSVRPDTTSTADPFAAGSTTSIFSVYGTGYSWVTYDNGCKYGSSMMPSAGTAVANVVGFEVPATLSSWGRSLQGLVVEPDSWIGTLDAPVIAASKAVADGFWRPWLTVALLVVAAVVLARSTGGRLADAMTGVVWALLVLVLSTWLVNYPAEATELVDDGITTATLTIANSFSGATSDETAGGVDGHQSSGAEKATAADVVDRQWDDIDRATNYNTWLAGTFGSSTSATAKKYGPPIFKSTHFSWAEQDRYDADPTGAGKEVREAKAKAFEKAADELKEADPIAYDHLTGNQWSNRLTAALTNWVLFLCTSFFLIVAGIGMVLAFVVTRLIVPIAPIAGVIFLVDVMKDVAINQVRRAAAIIFMGPAYLIVALVTLRFNSAVVASTLATPIKLVLVAAISYLAWRLIRPAAVAGMSSNVGRMMRTALAVKLGTRGLGENGSKEQGEEGGEDRSPQPYRHSYPRRDRPVAQPEQAALPPGTSALPYYKATPMARGTFVNRPAAEPEHRPHRQVRELSAAPAPMLGTPALGDATDTGYRTTGALPAGRTDGYTQTGPAPAVVDDLETAGPPARFPLPAGGQHPDAVNTTTEPSTTGEPVSDTSPDRYGSEVLEGSLMPSGTDLPPGTHEANMVWKEGVGFVQEIYRPSTVRRSTDV